MKKIFIQQIFNMSSASTRVVKRQRKTIPAKSVKSENEEKEPVIEMVKPTRKRKTAEPIITDPICTDPPPSPVNKKMSDIDNFTDDAEMTLSLNPIPEGDEDEEEVVDVTFPADTKPKRKRRRLCDECGEREALEKKKQRQFKWTEKNAAAFEKCQTVRRLNQAVEKAKKELASLLLFGVETQVESEKAFLENKAEAIQKLADLQDELSVYKNLKNDKASA
jgi:transcriptional regulator NrdR family protein